ALAAQSPLAQGKEKFLGSIHSSSQVVNFEQYWNQVTPENAGKWGSVEGTRDSYNWTALDAAYDFAKDNGFPFRYHVLLWGNQQPAWIETLSEEDQLEEIGEWMDAVADRYPDIDYLEVINEPINDPPNGAGNGDYYLALGGRGTSGFEWLLNGYRMARERFPNTKLVINEYNILNNPNRASTYMKIVELLKEESLVDIIGVQAHAFTTTAENAVLEGVLDQLATTGLPIMITEMDIDGPTDAEQLTQYKRIFPLLWEHPSVMGITLWGYRPGLWRNAEKAYLIDTDGSERPALTWLREYVEETDLSPKPLQSNLRRATIYPNPAEEYFTILGDEEVQSLRMVDLTGKEVLSVNQVENRRINVPQNITSGCYLVQLVFGSGERLVERIKIKK
ncbi:MAG: endo-1,4-beta-xylanase, partial [Marinoscillum sp.]